MAKWILDDQSIVNASNHKVGRDMRCIFLCAVTSFLMACGSGGGSSFVSGKAPQQLAINVTSSNIAGNITLNAGAFPVSQYENGKIYLADAENNLSLLNNTYSGNYAVSIVAGTYNSTYDLQNGGGSVPSNQGDIISTGVDATADDPALPIDVTAQQTSFTFTLDGGAFPVSEYDDANFYLEPTTGNGNPILLGNSHSPIDDKWLMPGTYNVIYEVETPGAIAPWNEHAVIGALTVPGPNVNIDITTAPLILLSSMKQPDTTVVAFPVSQYDHGEFYLRNTADSDQVYLGKSYELPLNNIPVISGTYDVVYKHKNGSAVPLNPDAVVGTAVDITATPTTVNLIINIADITPSYTLDGNPFPISEYNDALIYLRRTGTTFDVMLLGNTHDASPAAIRVVQGTYDVMYNHETGNAVPLNFFAIVQAGFVADADKALPVAVTSIDVTGAFTLNNNSFPTSQQQTANFMLRDSANAWDTFLLGKSHLVNEAVKIIPATYDVLYKHQEGSNVPQNTNRAAQSSVLLDTTQTLNVNVDARNVNPLFTLNGVAFPASIYQSALFYLRDVTNQDRFYLGASYTANDSVMAITGTYDVLYEHANGDTVPVNNRAVVDNVVIVP